MNLFVGEKRLTSGGFSITELMVVVLIVGIVAALATPYYMSYKKTACDQTAQSDLYHLQAAVQNWLTRNADPSTTAAVALKAMDPKGSPEYGWPGPNSKCQVEITFSGSVASAKAVKGTGAVFQLDMDGGSVNVSSGSQSLYSTDFNNADGLKFLTSNSSYSTDNGELTVTTKMYGQTVATIGDASWKDYTVNTMATLDSGPGYGIYYRFTGGDSFGTRNGYIFQYDPGLGNKLVVREVINGQETAPIQSADMSKFFPSGDIFGKEQQVSISVAGNQHIISLNGVQVFNFSDSTFQSGAVGLRTWANSIDNSVTRFNSLTVTQK
jgi:prepilin-type N-terminal cleavage/methylation domain-containing protein